MSSTTADSVTDRIKQTGGGVLRFFGLLAVFFVLGLLGAALLGETALKGWIVLLIFAFVFVTS